MNGKGSKRRPLAVAKDTFDKNWESIDWSGVLKKETPDEIDARLTKEYGGVYTEGVLSGSELIDQEREEE